MQSVDLDRKIAHSHIIHFTKTQTPFEASKVVQAAEWIQEPKGSPILRAPGIPISCALGLSRGCTAESCGDIKKNRA